MNQELIDNRQLTALEQQFERDFDELCQRYSRLSGEADLLLEPLIDLLAPHEHIAAKGPTPLHVLKPALQHITHAAHFILIGNWQKAEIYFAQAAKSGLPGPAIMDATESALAQLKAKRG